MPTHAATAHTGDTYAGTNAGTLPSRSSANQPSRANQQCAVARVFHCGISPIPIPFALESVHAGFPSVAQDYYAGDFSFDEHVIEHPDTTFIVTVAGDSMQGAGIWDGDLLIVDRSLEPQADDVVVAVLDGELTVKRLMMHNSKPILHAENPNYPDFAPSDMQDLVIWGVVTGNFHQQSRERRHTQAMPGITRPGATRHQSAMAEVRHETSNTAYRSLGWGQ